MSPSATIRFEDGAAYEQMMGRWSALAGEWFLDWLGPPVTGERWLDVGCGNGAFTELIVQRRAPAAVLAIDPSGAQLDYARGRLAEGAPVRWVQGDAMRLAAPDGEADIAVMALVLFFVPEPAVGVAEMCRGVRPGGRVAAYHWDILGGGFPLAAVQDEVRALGIQPPLPPSVAAAGLEASAALWRGAGLQQVRTTRIPVRRRFESFDDYWRIAITSNALQAVIAGLSPEHLEQLRANTRSRLNAGEGELWVDAHANAVSGTKV